MRLWHYELLPYLPDLQFRGQLRELIVVMRNWRDKGTPNQILVNQVLNYSKSDLLAYYNLYKYEYFNRYGKYPNSKYDDEFYRFVGYDSHKEFLIGYGEKIFPFWHTKEYLRICMANLYEKWYYAVGKSKITDSEWINLTNGYQQITGEVYRI